MNEKGSSWDLGDAVDVTRIEMMALAPGGSQRRLMEIGEPGAETRSVNRHQATARVPYIQPREGGGGRGLEDLLT